MARWRKKHTHDREADFFFNFIILVVFSFTFSHSLQQHQNQLILGVMGIDVSLNDIKKLTPRFTVSLTPMCDHVQADKFVTPRLTQLPSGAITCTIPASTQNHPSIKMPSLLTTTSLFNVSVMPQGFLLVISNSYYLLYCHMCCHHKVF